MGTKLTKTFWLVAALTPFLLCVLSGVSFGAAFLTNAPLGLCVWTASLSLVSGLFVQAALVERAYQDLFDSISAIQRIVDYKDELLMMQLDKGGIEWEMEAESLLLYQWRVLDMRKELAHAFFKPVWPSLHNH